VAEIDLDVTAGDVELVPSPLADLQLIQLTVRPFTSVSRRNKVLESVVSKETATNPLASRYCWSEGAAAWSGSPTAISQPSRRAGIKQPKRNMRDIS
jgi:hypothetical protein